MKIQFNIHFHTNPGEHIYICGSINEIGNWDTSKAATLNYIEDGNWSVIIDSSAKQIEYKYFKQDENNNIYWEWGRPRTLNVPKIKQAFILENDNWRAPENEEKVMYSSAFCDVLMKPDITLKEEPTRAKKAIQFKINAPRIGSDFQLCILGNQSSLGNWDKEKPFLLSCNKSFPLWKGTLNLSDIEFPVQYKYGIYNFKTKKVVTIEEGVNREIFDIPTSEKSFLYIKHDESFKYPIGNWKAAGVAVPIFSLRSEKSFGVGEFSDLKDFIDWAKNVGMKMVQVLPINETIASHNWLDSYPYKSISVMALHPIYMNLEKMGKLKDDNLIQGFKVKQRELNNETHVNYTEVLYLKSKYYKLLFDQEKKNFFKQKDYKLFFKANEHWLVPYAAFVYLRDKMKTPNFRKWKEFSTYDENKIKQISTPKAKEWDDIAVHYFIQYHLDKQLKEVSNYARENKMVLKGDIPIGISPNSVEAWTEPHLFNLNAQAGAPPDDFAIKGQNWGFPTYNWGAMAKENYKWWRDRLQKMADYFDAYRIDHILGFFRIWEIPIDAVEGLLGYFNPALGLTADEIRNYDIHFDYKRFVKPHIRLHHIKAIFGEDADEVINKYVTETSYCEYELKEEYNTQVKVNNYFLKDKEEEDLSDHDTKIRDGLFELVANVLFIQTGENEFHPRISVHDTSSFADLDEHTKSQLTKIYFHYFYQKHNDFWYQKGMEKLPHIIEASNMLVCGEDLGMVPECVPPVMHKLNILSLEIQRMSKNPKLKFAHPANAPYLSVCTTSTHDMSTIRGWWEEDKALIKDFYNHELGNFGEAPYFAEPWICVQIINQHMHSPAMWTTFPIQDLIAMDGNFRWKKTQLEQINYPSNVRHHWKFRMQQSIDDLKNEESFNQLLKELIEESGRNSPY
ncbi:4-alpha-glucanotransferase [Labilibacter sediminis]|nr:4-alpha-glucanotransferase [Labilibacter sediminis]